MELFDKVKALTEIQATSGFEGSRSRLFKSSYG